MQGVGDDHGCRTGCWNLLSVESDSTGRYAPLSGADMRVAAQFENGRVCLAKKAAETILCVSC